MHIELYNIIFSCRDNIESLTGSLMSYGNFKDEDGDKEFTVEKSKWVDGS